MRSSKITPMLHALRWHANSDRAPHPDVQRYTDEQQEEMIASMETVLAAYRRRGTSSKIEVSGPLGFPAEFVIHGWIAQPPVDIPRRLRRPVVSLRWHDGDLVDVRLWFNAHDLFVYIVEEAREDIRIAVEWDGYPGPRLSPVSILGAMRWWQLQFDSAGREFYLELRRV